MLRTNFWNMILRDEAEGAGGSGDPAPADAAAAAAAAGKPSDKPDVGSVLFPTEKKPDDKAEDSKGAGDKDDKKPDDKADPPAEWKEYVADPKKSEAENAAAKAEHDKTKPAEETAEQKAEREAAEAAAAVIPEDGKYALKMPEGMVMDEARLAALGPILAKHKLTTGVVQEIIDADLKVQADRVAAEEKAWGETTTKWLADAEADKEIGGDKWEQTKALAFKATTALGTPALKEYLEATGGGNHPELIRIMAKVGALIKEDVPPKGGAEGGGRPAEAAHILFPNDKPKG